jgi:hypothetical protein
MALNRNGRPLLSSAVVVAILIGVPAFAWGQSADDWRRRLEGNWCDAERGCTHWWTLFDVRVDADNNIEIRYRDQPSFVFFVGKIQEPVGRWTIKGKITGGKHDGKEFEAAISSLDYLKEVVQGKFKGSLKAKIQAAEIEGIRVKATSGIAISGVSIDEPKIDEVKIDKPKLDAPEAPKPGVTKPSDARIEGSNVKIDGVTLEKAEIKEPRTEGTTLEAAKELKAESLRADAMEAKRLRAQELEGKKISGKKIVGKEIEGGNQIEVSIPIQITEATIEGIAKPKRDKGRKEGDADDDDGQGKQRIAMEGWIKGKIAGSTGPVDLKGDFEGTFTALVQAVVKGSYGVPPPACSEAGRPLSEEERSDLRIRRRVKSGLREDRPGRFFTEKEEKDTKKFKLLIKPSAANDAAKKASEAVQGFVDAAKKATTQIFVDAMPTAAPRPAEPHTRGRFMRKVTGAVSAIEPATIVLDLPPLPVLDHKCSVIDELPKRTLKLVKQHDGVR